MSDAPEPRRVEEATGGRTGADGVRLLFEALGEEGAVWVEESCGLMFRRQGERLVLVDRMPHVPDMPFTAERLLEAQRAQYEDIRRGWAAAGIEVVGWR
jgi:hypothetical protein